MRKRPIIAVAVLLVGATERRAGPYSYNAAMPGEFDFIDWIRSQQPRTDAVPVPAGDDLAVLKWPAGDLLLVGVDQVLDGVHFDSAIHPRARSAAR